MLTETLSRLVLAVFLSLGAVKHQVQKIHSYLIIGDKHSALQEAKAYALKSETPEAYLLWLKATCVNEDEEGAFEIWRQIHERFGELAYDRDVLETLSWSIIQKGFGSFNPSIRLLSLLCGGITQDIEGMKLIHKGLKDRNAHIRSLSLELASWYGDEPLKQEVIKLYKKEHLWQVKSAAILAAGKMKITSLIPEFLNTLSYSHASFEEKKVMMQSLLQMKDEIDLDKVRHLAKSNRAMLRCLACETLRVTGDETSLELLTELSFDSNIKVKLAAIEALACLQMPINPKVFDSFHHPELNVIQGWLDLIKQKKECSTLKQALVGEDQATALFAAAAVAQGGVFAKPLMIEMWEEPLDDYVKANLALGFLWQREKVQEAASFLASFLKTHKEPLMWSDSFFHPLKRSDLKYHPAIMNYPEAVNQATRLDLLNLLAITGYSEAQETIKDFLQESRFGICGLAAVILLGEGDSTAIDCVKQLLDDTNKEIRTQAALALAIWGKDHVALPMLMEIYHESDRSTKLKILEALGKVGSSGSIDFLIEQMQSSSQSIRVAASAVLLQTLNH